MNKFKNNSHDMIAEMLDGYLSMYPNLFKKVPAINGLIECGHGDKVSIVIGGGSGNEPWVIGYVGQGLATGASLGQVYISPPARSILKVTKAVPNRQGVLYIAGNHAGDVLNFELVADLAALEGIETKCVFVTDDLASARFGSLNERRGGPGIALVIKIAGAACSLGYSLVDVAEIAQKANKMTRSIGVSSSPGYMPGTGKAMFELPDGEIEYGMGFNGEPGLKRVVMPPADEVVETLLGYLDQDWKFSSDDNIVLMINGYGFTSPMELCIMARRIHQILTGSGVKIHDSFIDNIFCPQGAGGFSITILRLDEELEKMYQQPAWSPFFRQHSNLNINSQGAR